jgi:CheY-like chemotaxis protein
LLHNAVKFTFSGTIEFGYVKSGDYLLFYVKDSGIGIAENHFEDIFKPFRQVELEITRVPGGTGLGLSISKKLVGLMGGEIWLESEPGTGTTFYFKIPLVYSDLTPGAEKNYTREYSGDPGKIKILLAEDDEVSYLYLKEIMTGYGIELKWAHNGLQAVDICSEDKDLDLVLMDIKMPDMNGIEATKKIREIRSDLPVIAVTAFAKNEDRLTALSAGCNDFLSKPIKKEDLLMVLARYSNRISPEN